MKLIVCLDDAGGMMFNHRRQSRDRVLIADMLQHVGTTPLWVTPYSAPLFPEDCASLQVVPDPAKVAGENDYCFVEDAPLPTYDEVKDRLKKNALGMSGGQQQRLCIARALLKSPKILILHTVFFAYAIAVEQIVCRSFNAFAFF